MNDRIATLTIVIAELNLAVAKLAAGADDKSVPDLLAQAAKDLAKVIGSYSAVDPIRTD